MRFDTIKAKLIMGFGLLLVILAWMGSGTYYAVRKLNRLSAYAHTKAVSTSEELKSLVARFKVNTDGAESAFETNSQNRSRAAHA